MKTIVIGNTTPNQFMRPFVGTRAQITAANLPNGTLAIVTDEAENSIDLTVVYPVGSIYMNATDDINPGTLFGIGTWSLIDSKFLYGCNSLMSDLGDTGGATTVTLTQNNLPASLTNMTISSLTGSTSTESTDHNHTVTVTVGNVTGSSSTWTHTHSNSIEGEGHTSGVGFKWDFVQPTTPAIGAPGAWSENGTQTAGMWHSHTINPTDLQHTHTASTTVGNQSEHATHSHTITTTAGQTVSLGSVGSGTAFSILPTYRKCAIWFRTN